MIRAGVCLQLLGLLAFASVCLADDPVPIGSILARPDSYNAYTVTLQGVARNVQAIGPYVMVGCGTVYDTYRFILEDESGALDVTVPGPCGKPAGTMVPISEGDKVVVQAQITVLRGPPVMGGAISGGDRLPPPMGTAKTIRRQD